MEQLEVHSKSYLVRWVSAAAGNTITWTLQPGKRPISFGIFKHAGSSHATIERPSSSSAERVDFDAVDRKRHESEAADKKNKPQPTKPSEMMDVQEKLQTLGLTSVAWHGRCDADRVSIGHYDVPNGESGMYALVFDNTTSKQFSRTVTFAVKVSPNIGSDSTSDDLKKLDSRVLNPDVTRPRSRTGNGSSSKFGDAFYTGNLSKKRRKRNQGYARRFFTLDFTSSTLSYYRNRHSSALRGAIPLSLAAIASDERRREISIDSGAEIWMLRAQNKKDFDGWRNALEQASQTIRTPQASLSLTKSDNDSMPQLVSNPLEERDWRTVEALVGRVSGITGAVRRLAKDTDPKYLASGAVASNGPSHGTPSPTENGKIEYFNDRERSTERPGFWKRRSSAGGPPQPRRIPSQPSPTLQVPRTVDMQSIQQHGENVHDHCMVLLRDLESVVADFSSLVSENRRRRIPERPVPPSRRSIDSANDEEFFDAEDDRPSPFFTIQQDSEAEGSPERDPDSVSNDSASTIADDEMDNARYAGPSFFPSKPDSLYPLPHEKVDRRKTVQISKASPPSLISFLRKNVGKDLSTIAMPVTSNEPTSLLQRQAEQMEAAYLLHQAAKLGATAKDDVMAANKRLLYVTAFAIAPISSTRMRERAIRKPFNPMLGETFELVREDLGFRFLAEKVSHRPVRIACQADGGNESSGEWTFTHAPAPSQKFWGKSAELVTQGRARVVLHACGEKYSWTPATAFLRNVIAGEKYVEPVGTMTVVEETTGRRALVTFKAGGMFSGRSEEVSVQASEGNGSPLALGLKGKWTTHLSFAKASGEEEGEPIWTAGPLVEQAQTHYGMTVFAASMNEIGAMEKGVLPPTDSRLRPDQRQYEDGEIDAAEKTKAALEEAQRKRRTEMESKGEHWQSRWFGKLGGDGEQDGEATGDEAWAIRSGHGEDYWSVRRAVVDLKNGHWDGVREVFEM